MIIHIKNKDTLIVEEFKFIKNGKAEESIIIILKLILIVLQNGMNILNVSLPNKM